MDPAAVRNFAIRFVPTYHANRPSILLGDDGNRVEEVVRLFQSYIDKGKGDERDGDAVDMEFNHNAG